MQVDRSLLTRLLVGLCAALAVVATIPLVIDYLSYRTINITLSPSTKVARIYDTQGMANITSSKQATPLVNLDKTGNARLKDGTYYVIPEGQDISSAIIPITISYSTKNIDIKPSFSNKYLMQHFSDQIPAINGVITKQYTPIISDYIIDNGTFYKLGDWYITTLHRKPAFDNENIDTYGVILQKKGDSWTIAAAPSIFFPYNKNQSLPKDVIDQANRTVNSY